FGNKMKNGLFRNQFLALGGNPARICLHGSFAIPFPERADPDMFDLPSIYLVLLSCMAIPPEIISVDIPIVKPVTDLMAMIPTLARSRRNGKTTRNRRSFCCQYRIENGFINGIRPPIGRKKLPPHL